MVKNFCDRCGKELVSRKIFRKIQNNNKELDVTICYNVERFGRGYKKYEICHECAVEFLNFMNDEDSFIQNARVDTKEDN